ncbi:hypothetical protein EEB14_51040 [Rhodococcus sp. WS4]|nr:hypothetical protein EEB14_51040 [Rhodococcus sp. WS4]
MGPDRDLHAGTSAVPTTQWLTEPSVRSCRARGRPSSCQALERPRASVPSSCRRGRHGADDRPHSHLQTR